MIESAAFLPKPVSLFAGIGVVVSMVLMKRADLAWGRAVPGTSPEQLALFAFVLLFLCALSLSFWGLDASRRRAFREIGRLDRAIGRLSDINAAFQDALASADEDFSLRERNRITREIHDIIGYALTNQQMMLEAALLLTDEGDGRLRELLGMARSTVAEGLRDARRALYELRQGESRPEDLGFGLLLKVVRNFESVTGVRVALDFTNARGELSRGAWLTLYRLIQESMINAFRHGDAKNIAITFREDRRDLFVNVRDDGRGAVNVTEGIGLKGMRERAEALGGELWAGNAADGFVVSARLPKGPERMEDGEAD
jgi:signal transduction histidine kinase